MSRDAIPLVDLHAQYTAHRDEFDAALRGCLERTSFIGGPDHEAFRKNFARWCGDGAAALVGNGTDALVLALIELLGTGDGSGEVITVSHTFIATSEAIKQAGYRTVFVDIDPDTYLMDLDALEAAIGPRTRAVLVVHLYGQMPDMARLRRIADRHSVAVVEDAAQAHGARYDGVAPGMLGDAACFSFYPGKNLGCWGDGGAVFSRDAELIRRIEMRANHGRLEKYLHQFEGLNSRLDGLQAAILDAKLRHIDKWNEARQRVAAWYDQLLAGRSGIKTPAVDPKANHVFHLYVVEVDDRDAVKERLNKAGIGAGIHYPVPLHMQPAFTHMGHAEDDFPATARAAARVLSLPIYPEITRAQVERVVEVLVGATGS
jgi:dTDP-4-amino-4,6-dideoxygalactose transaminase